MEQQASDAKKQLEEDARVVDLYKQREQRLKAKLKGGLSQQKLLKYVKMTKALVKAREDQSQLLAQNEALSALVKKLQLRVQQREKAGREGGRDTSGASERASGSAAAAAATTEESADAGGGGATGEQEEASDEASSSSRQRGDAQEAEEADSDGDETLAAREKEEPRGSQSDGASEGDAPAEGDAKSDDDVPFAT